MNLVRRRPGPSRLRFILAVLAVAGFTLSAAGSAAATQGIAMHGVPKYDPTFTHFSYVDPDAPKGGRLVLGRTGTFDSLNPFIVRGNPADGRQWTQQSLLARSYDEPFSLYGLIADSVETPADRSSVTFHLRPGARFHDGSE
ncbi:MAG TPA: ABC transporter substrate-binding protein, partial [Alphaproteobacteria bacterium]|nr:ABC transporter substrate-binding protein [Alphaproteobacteria bacterium]